MERKEAIEVIKKNYPHVNESGSQFETALRILIPELKSEDERIKEDIITYLSTVEDKELIPYETWIFWLEKRSEQKPAEWTHKDGKNLAELWEILSVHRNTNPQVDNLMEWIKDLVSYKRQEWSEEDEAVLDALIRRLEGEDIYVSPHLAVESLKSIKERYTWKPSDEQINALHDAAVFVDMSMFPYPKGILMKLYKQLKKLREE